MPSTTSLLSKLAHTFPHLAFHEGSDFQWDFAAQTITYPTPNLSELWSASLLHEVAHSALQHQSYARDIELLAKERDAWKYAQTQLASLYDTPITPGIISAAMDSYRDWLHARSTCPTCKATGIETRKHHYTCPACQHEWHVNEARICGLRRYGIQKSPQ